MATQQPYTSEQSSSSDPRSRLSFFFKIKTVILLVCREFHAQLITMWILRNIIFILYCTVLYISGGFVWTDGGPYSYSKWAEGEPSDEDCTEGEDCISRIVWSTMGTQGSGMISAVRTGTTSSASMTKACECNFVTVFRCFEAYSTNFRIVEIDFELWYGRTDLRRFELRLCPL